VLYCDLQWQQAGQRVVLSDCDLRRPRILVYFERRPNRRNDELARRENLEQAIQNNDCPILALYHPAASGPTPAEICTATDQRSSAAAKTAVLTRVTSDSRRLWPLRIRPFCRRCVDGSVLVVRAYRHDEGASLSRSPRAWEMSGKWPGSCSNASISIGKSINITTHYYKRDGYYADTSGSRPLADGRLARHLLCRTTSEFGFA